MVIVCVKERAAIILRQLLMRPATWELSLDVPGGQEAGTRKPPPISSDLAPTSTPQLQGVFRGITIITSEQTCSELTQGNTTDQLSKPLGVQEAIL